MPTAISCRTFSLASPVEMMMGHGMPPTQRFLDRGLRPSLSVDVETNVPSAPAAPAVTNVTFSSNQGYALSSDVHSHAQLAGNILTNNGGNGMEIRGGTIQVSQQWDQTSVVHIVTGDITVAATRQLAVSPGLIVKLQDDRSLRELGLELSGVLEKSGRQDEALAVRLSVLLAEPPPVPVEPLLRHGVPGAASRSAATRALARRALEVALDDPVWPPGQDRARVADLLQKLKSGG